MGDKSLPKTDPFYWIEKYAIAQSEMDVDVTIHHKNMICGSVPLVDVPIKKLEQLITKLRRVYSGHDNRHRPREKRWDRYNEYKMRKYGKMSKRADWDG